MVDGNSFWFYSWPWIHFHCLSMQTLFSTPAKVFGELFRHVLKSWKGPAAEGGWCWVYSAALLTSTMESPHIHTHAHTHTHTHAHTHTHTHTHTHAGTNHWHSSITQIKGEWIYLQSFSLFIAWVWTVYALFYVIFQTFPISSWRVS